MVRIIEFSVKHYIYEKIPASIRGKTRPTALQITSHIMHHNRNSTGNPPFVSHFCTVLVQNLLNHCPSSRRRAWTGFDRQLVNPLSSAHESPSINDHELRIFSEIMVSMEGDALPPDFVPAEFAKKCSC